MRVLVVDDEPGLVALLTRFLESAGHQVVGATRWDAALADGSYDAALVDWQVARTEGRLIAAQLAASGLDAARLAVMSGHHDAVTAPYRLFPKPFQLADVLTWIRGLEDR
jgi:DNA-binding response OmpR family regulator